MKYLLSVTHILVLFVLFFNHNSHFANNKCCVQRFVVCCIIVNVHLNHGERSFFHAHPNWVMYLAHGISRNEVLLFKTRHCNRSDKKSP